MLVTDRRNDRQIARLQYFVAPPLSIIRTYNGNCYHNKASWAVPLPLAHCVWHVRIIRLLTQD